MSTARTLSGSWPRSRPKGAGSALRRRRTAETGEALEAIVTTGRGALVETRRLLGVVRRPVDAETELAPQPGLGDLPALAARVRQAGTPVQVRLTGTVRPLPDGIELSAYRIIQEALTNIMKHGAPGATADVRVHYADDELTVEIIDENLDSERAVVPPPGHAPAAPGSAAPGSDAPGSDSPGGHSLVGMQARVGMLGGDLAVGPRDRGFGVRARQPLPVKIP